MRTVAQLEKDAGTLARDAAPQFFGFDFLKAGFGTVLSI
jgi:hypothetical protein